MTVTTLENLYINGNQNIKKAIDIAFKINNYDRVSDLLKIEFVTHDGSISDLTQIRNRCNGQAMLYNPVFNNFASPTVSSNKDVTPFIVARQDFINEDEPILIIGLTYSIVYIYYYLAFKNEVLSEEPFARSLLIKTTLTYISEYKAFFSYIDSYPDVDLKNMMDGSVDSSIFPPNAPLALKNGFNYLLACSYFARLRAAREHNKIKQDEFWPVAEEFGEKNFGSAWQDIKDLFLSKIKNFSDILSLQNYEHFIAYQLI